MACTSNQLLPSTATNPRVTAPLRRFGSRALLVVSVLGVAVGVAGCGESVSTGSYTGESRLVAKRISAFQKDVTNAEPSKICLGDLAGPLKDSIAASQASQAKPSADRHLAKEPTERAATRPNTAAAGATFSATPAQTNKTCEAAIKEQLRNVESLPLNIASIVVHGDRATAKVLSTWSGKERYATLKLAKERGTWLIAGL
jgi:hypothetical protein